MSDPPALLSAPIALLSAPTAHLSSPTFRISATRTQSANRFSTSVLLKGNPGRSAAVKFDETAMVVNMIKMTERMTIKMITMKKMMVVVVVQTMGSTTTRVFPGERTSGLSRFHNSKRRFFLQLAPLIRSISRCPMAVLCFQGRSLLRLVMDVQSMSPSSRIPFGPRLAACDNYFWRNQTHHSIQWHLPKKMTQGLMYPQVILLLTTLALFTARSTSSAEFFISVSLLASRFLCKTRLGEASHSSRYRHAFE